MKIDLKLRLGTGEDKMSEKGMNPRVLCFHYVVQDMIYKCVSPKIFLLCKTS